MISILFILAFIGWYSIGYFSVLFWFKHFAPQIVIDERDRDTAHAYAILGPILFIIGAALWLASKIYR